LLGNHSIGCSLAAAGIASVYGAAGAIVIVPLWVYYSSQGVLFGAAFTRFTPNTSARPGTERKCGACNPKKYS
jgi:membrane protein